MLATHVINGSIRPSLSRADFAALLQESLGTDEEGRRNIGKDVSVNFKLISVIVQIGVEPLIFTNENDPFHKRIDQGRNAPELKCCLDVIVLVLKQTPKIIFHDAGSAGIALGTVLPVYAWLLVIVLSVVVQTRNVEIHQRCGETLQACLDADEKCSCGSCGTVVDLFQEVVSGMYTICSGYIPLIVQALSKESSSTSRLASAHDLSNGVDTAIQDPSISPYCQKILQEATIRQPNDHIEAALFTTQALLFRTLPKPVVIQLKKNLKLLQNAARRTAVPQSNERHLEVRTLATSKSIERTTDLNRH